MYVATCDFSYLSKKIENDCHNQTLDNIFCGDLYFMFTYGSGKIECKSGVWILMCTITCILKKFYHRHIIDIITDM